MIEAGNVNQLKRPLNVSQDESPKLKPTIENTFSTCNLSEEEIGNLFRQSYPEKRTQKATWSFSVSTLTLISPIHVCPSGRFSKLFLYTDFFYSLPVLKIRSFIIRILNEAINLFSWEKCYYVSVASICSPRSAPTSMWIPQSYANIRTSKRIYYEVVYDDNTFGVEMQYFLFYVENLYWSTSNGKPLLQFLRF